MSFVNEYNEHGVLDWVFEEETNKIKTISKSDAVTTENEIIFLLTTGFANTVVKTEDGITGSFNVVMGENGNPVGDDVISIASQMVLPASDDALRDLELSCVLALESLRDRAGVTDIQCIASVEDLTIFITVAIGINKDQVEEYQIKLWGDSSKLQFLQKYV